MPDSTPLSDEQIAFLFRQSNEMAIQAVLAATVLQVVLVQKGIATESEIRELTESMRPLIAEQVRKASSPSDQGHPGKIQ